MSKKNTTLILLISLVLVVSGCIKKPATNNNVTPSNVEGQNTNTSTSTATSTSSGQAQEIDTRNWKTYRNEEYGFEMGYPSEWLLTEGDKKIEFYSKAWQDEGREFFKSLIGSELTLSFYEDVPDNIEDWILKKLDLQKYKSIQEAVDNVIDIHEYGQIEIDGETVDYLILGAEVAHQNFFIKSKRFPQSVIELSLNSFQKEKEAIIASIKL
ncbi:MAG: hypothetical protein HY979_03255 [Candidatus Magasanikbacteria bacterium]|nr:hypothetical protein [Candidatus Magasanikbacteria bacterium]